MCEWRSRYSASYECHLEPEAGSRFCIFHSPESKDAALVHARLMEQLHGNGPRKNLNPPYDWSGYLLPQSLDLSNMTLEDSPCLREAVIHGDLLCYNTVFEGGIYLWKAKIEGDAVFENAKLGGWIGDDGAAYSKGVVIFFGTRIDGRLRLQGASFLHDTNFDGCEATSLDLGWNAPRLSGKNRKGIALELPGTGNSFWRYAARQFEQEGRRNEADAAHYFERVARWRQRLRLPFYVQMQQGEDTNRWQRLRKAVPHLPAKLPTAAEWIVDLLLLRLPTAYGASLGRLAATWVTLISLFALLFTAMQALSEPISFGEAYYFSVVTFTTLGFGDLWPVGSVGRILAALEATLGGITMALSVLVIGRKFMR